MDGIRKALAGILARGHSLKVGVLARLLGIDYLVRELPRCPGRIVAGLLRRHGARIGRHVSFKDPIYIDNASGDVDARGDFSNLNIGDSCYIGKGVFFDLPDEVVIGEECAVSAGVKFITHSDCGHRPMSRWYPRSRGPIRIGCGSWIGVDAVILHGVELGRFCVVGAGAVVTAGFPDYSVVAGTPARLVKTLAPAHDKLTRTRPERAAVVRRGGAEVGGVPGRVPSA